MKPFNVGVLGIGDISDVYISNLKSYDIVSVVACAGRDLEKARRKAEAHGLPKAYATAAELIADPDIDIVLNLTLPAVHAELTTMALEAGKHVYTEKPLAATYVEGERILALAKERGLSVCCAPDTILGGRQWYGPRPPGAGYHHPVAASREKYHADRSHWPGPGEICL